MPNALVVLYLAGGQDGLNVIVPNSSTDYPLYAQMRPMIGRIQGPSAGGKVGSLPIPTTGGELAFAAPTVSSAGGGDNGDAELRLRHALRHRRRRRRLEPGAAAGDRLHAAQPLAFHQPGLLVLGRARVAEHRLARSLARPLRLEHEPAAGHLDRLLAVEDAAQRRRLRSARSPRSTSAGFALDAGGGAHGGDSRRRRPERGARAARGAARRQPVARPHARRLRPRARRAAAAQRAQQRDVRQRLPGQLLPGLPAAAGGGPARGRLRHARDHDQLGRLRHPRRPDLDAGSAAGRAVALPRRLPGRPHRARHRRPGRDADVLRVRPRASRTTPRAGPTTARAA